MEAKEEDKRAKDKMKKYKDASRHVREQGIEVGDLVIAKRKITKHDSARKASGGPEINDN